MADAAQPSEIEISLETMPTIDTGMAYGVTLPAVDEEVVVLALADVDAAAAAADEHAGARLVDPQAGVVPRLARGDDADERGARIALRIGAAARSSQMSSPLERRHVVDGDAAAPAPRPAGELRRVELGDRARAAAAAADVVPEPLAADAERRDDADAGDDDAAAPLVDMFPSDPEEIAMRSGSAAVPWRRASVGRS